MSSRTLQVTPQIHDYLATQTLREPEVLSELRRETSRLPAASMQTSAEQAQFMRLLVEILGARRTIEVGVFTGYSTISVALGLPPDGRIVACDISEEYTQVARRYFARAGVADKIELHIAPASSTLQALVDGGGASTFDFAYIDADKEGYPDYYERCLGLLRPGGVVAIDNALWSGKVADPSADDADTRAIRELNARVRDDQRVSMSLLPVGDGLLLARKR